MITRFLSALSSLKACNPCRFLQPGSPLINWALILLCLSAPPQVLSAQSCNPLCSVSVVNSHPLDYLRDISDQLGIHIAFEGELRDRISVQFQAQSVDHLVREVAGLGGYLVNQRGSSYTLFGGNVEEVTIAVSPRHLSPERAAEHLEQFREVDILLLEEANAIVLSGTSENVRQAAEFLRAIDLDLPNVFLELLVVEYYHEDAFIWAYDIVDGSRGKLSELLVVPGAGTIGGNYEALADLPKSFRLNLTALVQDSEAPGRDQSTHCGAQRPAWSHRAQRRTQYCPVE
jgi:hypothetical protein